MRLRTLAGGGLLLVVLGGAFLLGRRGDTPAEVVGVQETPVEPGYVALGAEIIETAADGTLLYSLNAERIEQQPASGDVTMQAITMLYHRDADTRWQLKANRGHLKGGTTRVELTGAVRATGTLPQSRLPAEIATEQLDFDTQSQDLVSRQLVTIRIAGQRLSARGLTASLKQERVRLESAVHGRYSR
jgi:LPS export ABC transporter protein LptC